MGVFLSLMNWLSIQTCEIIFFTISPLCGRHESGRRGTKGDVALSEYSPTNPTCSPQSHHSITKTPNFSCITIRLMRKFLVPILVLGMAASASAQQLSKNKAATDVKWSGPDGYTLTVNFGSVSAKPSEEDWKRLDVNMDHLQYLNIKGEPAMPFMGYSFLVGDDNMEVTVADSKYEDFTGYDIVPSKGKLSRKVDPSTIRPQAGPVYKENKYYPENIATVVNDYVVHDAHGKTVWVYPVQYNPVTHSLRVYTEVTLRVKAKMTNKPEDASSNKIWNNIYRRHFINYQLLGQAAGKATAAGDSVGCAAKMLIITPHVFADTIKGFIKWKNQQGIRTWVTETTAIPGYPAQESIYAYVKQFYQTNHIDYLLLVGDDGAITPRMDSGLVDNANLTFAGPSDISYGYLAGNDHYPDIFVGRLSANNVQELGPQLVKTIGYEKNPNMAQTWYGHAVGLGSNLGPGDDNEMDWEHMRNIRGRLMSGTYTQVGELYDSTHGGQDAPGDPSPSDLVSQINGGVSLVNYCGHGWDGGIVTSGFQSSDVYSLTNTAGQWPFVLIVGCEVGSFVGEKCFAEYFQETTDGSGNPIGSVANFMSTISQYWDEPMQTQDEVNDIISYHSADTLDNLGPIVEAGCMSMNDQYLQSGYDMTDTWTLFGDPSLQFRKKNPTTLTVTHPATITPNWTSVNVTVNNNDATVTLMHRDTLFSVRHVMSGATHHGFASLQAGDSIMVSVTAPNTKPYFGVIKVVAPTDVNTVAVNTDGISIFPNPAQNTVRINGIGADVAYKVTDMSGKTVLSGTTVKGSIDISQLATGTYALELQNGDKKTALPLQVVR